MVYKNELARSCKPVQLEFMTGSDSINIGSMLVLYEDWWQIVPPSIWRSTSTTGMLRLRFAVFGGRVLEEISVWIKSIFVMFWILLLWYQRWSSILSVHSHVDR